MNLPPDPEHLLEMRARAALANDPAIRAPDFAKYTGMERKAAAAWLERNRASLKSEAAL